MSSPDARNKVQTIPTNFKALSASSDAIASISDDELNFVAEQDVVRFIMAFNGIGSNEDRQLSISYKFTTPVLDLRKRKIHFVCDQPTNVWGTLSSILTIQKKSFK